MPDQSNKLLQENIALTKGVQKANEDLVGQLKNSITTYNELLGVQKQLNENLKKATNSKVFAAAQKELQASIKNTSLAEKESIEIQKKAQQLERERIKTAQAQAAAAKRVKKETEALTSAYKRDSAELTRLRNAAKDVGVQFGITSKQFKAAAKEVNVLDQRLRRVDSALGQNQRNVGNYRDGVRGLTNSFRGLAGALGVVGGVQLLARGLKSAFDISKKYEKQNAVLASVLGKTLKQTKNLQKQSKELGSSTAFSATQVTELHTELARLGKTEEEIIASTEGIIDATLALGSETGETAALVGATLNAFQLGASESGKVADVLTLATQKSALSFEKLNTAIPIAAGAAAAANVPFERMVAQLGQAADRGIDASSAATSLRNIYISLAENGLTLEAALQRINTSQNRLTEATNLFGKRAAVTALALADTIDNTDKLTESLDNAGGTAKKVAETQLNTLDGQLKLMNSAWEGLILSINNSETALGSFSLSAVKFGTNVINQFANIGKEAELLRRSLIGGFESADGALLKYIADTGRVEDSNGNIRSVKDVLDEVADAYKNLSFENQQFVDVNENLAIALLKAGAEAEAVDGVVREYVKNLNLEKKELKDLNFEYDDSSDLLDDQKKSKEELNEITKESIRLADQELDRISRKVDIPDKLDPRVDATKEANRRKVKEQMFTKVALEGATERYENWAKLQEKQTDTLDDEEKKRAEIKKQWLEFGFDAAQDIANTLFELGRTRRENELQEDISAQQARLDNDNLDAEQREEIQKDIAKKEKELRKQKAKEDRKAALFEIAINTAIGAAKAIAGSPLTFGLPFLPFVIAQGAVQAALIASQPLPQFDKGSDSLPSGNKIVAEKRPEILFHNGQAELITSPTILGDAYTGDKLIGGAATANLYDNISRGEIIEGANKKEEQVYNMMIAAAIDKSMGKHIEKQTKSLITGLKQSSKAHDYRISDSRNKYRDA